MYQDEAKERLPKAKAGKKGKKGGAKKGKGGGKKGAKEGGGGKKGGGKKGKDPTVRCLSCMLFTYAGNCIRPVSTGAKTEQKSADELKSSVWMAP